MQMRKFTCWKPKNADTEKHIYMKDITWYYEDNFAKRLKKVFWNTITGIHIYNNMDTKMFLSYMGDVPHVH